MNKSKKIYIAGHRGMVGSAIWRALEAEGYTNLVGKSSSELDLTQQNKVNLILQNEKVDIVIDAAARVGGILANNSYPYQFIMDNMLIQNNLINGAFEQGIKKFIFLVENLTFIYVITFIYSYYFERDCRKKEEITEKKTEAALFEILG